MKTKSFLKRETLLSLLFLFIIMNIAQTQTCLKCYDNPLEVTGADENVMTKAKCPDSLLLNQLAYRQLQYEFHHSLRKIHEPSTMSMLSNWTHHNLGHQKKNYVLNSDLNIPIAIQGPRKWGLNVLHIIPRFKFRILQNDDTAFALDKSDESYPVRTPSAMAGVAYYWSRTKWWKSTYMSKVFKNKYLGVYAFHHSNGQDGMELDTVNIGEINTYNGNFGENLVFEFIVGGRKNIEFYNNKFYGGKLDKIKMKNNKLGRILNLKPTISRELYWRVSYEWHPKMFTNEVFDALDMYGRHRINFNLSYLVMPQFLAFMGDGEKWCLIGKKRNFEKWRHTLNLSYIIDEEYKRGNFNNPEMVKMFNLKRRLNATYTLYCIIGKSQYSALFAQAAYLGSDHYNIYFNNSLWSLRVGFAFGFFDQPTKGN